MKNEKKYQVIIALMVLISLGACKKNMDELFQNPESFTSTKIDYLLPTGIDQALRQDYGDVYTNHLRTLSPILQVTASTADPVSSNFYDFSNSRDKGRWGDYFTGKMVNLKGIEQLYDYTLNENQKEEYKVYYWIAKILQAYSTARATDYFDDMPYTEAFKAQNSLYNQPVVLYPKYDTQKTIYPKMVRDNRHGKHIYDSR